jgi:hypothetical protein
LLSAFEQKSAIFGHLNARSGLRWAAVPAEKREGGQNVSNNTDPLECSSRKIAHRIVKLFKSRLNSTTHVGFHCHCGHKGGVQFTDYQAMTSPVAWALPWRQCERILAAWRAHTKDLDGVHPNAEDQIRDFFTRQLEQPGGPTRYPLTAIPLNTPKPKSIAISAYVDEALRGILVDYAEKLGIQVEPPDDFEWYVTSDERKGDPIAIMANHPTENVATATAMREYLARLLYGDEGLVENLLRREEAEQPISFPNEVSPPLAIATETRNDFANDPELTTKQAPSSDRPTRIILRSYAANDKPRIERLLGLARQLQIPVQLAGPWSCTAFPKGEEAHPALDVVFPEVLVHPRDVLIISDGDEHHDGNGEKRLFSPSLTEAENQILWAAREEDQRFITGLIELLGLHAEASRADIAAAVEAKGLSQPTAGHPGWMECLALSDRVRNILGAVDGEETDEAARRFVEEQKKVHSWRDSVFALRTETAENQRKLLAILNAGTVDPSWQRCLDYAEARMKNAAQFESEVVDAMELPAGTVQGHVVKWAKVLVGQNKYQTGKLAEILGYKSDDYCELLQQVQRVIREHQTLLGERIESNAKIDRLCASLDRVVEERDGLSQRVVNVQKTLGDTEAEYDRSQIELAKALTEINKLRAARLPCGGCSTHLERAEKERDSLGEKLDNVHRGLAERLGLPKDTGWGGITSAVERIVEDSQDHAEVRANNKELGVKLSQANLTIEALRGTLSRAEKERDEAKERLETAIAAERQTIAQRIDLALTGNAVATHIDTMLRAVEHLAVSSKLLNLIADALDAPSEEKAFTNDDGSLNIALVDRILSYYHRLYTAAGYTEPPQGGWEELLTHIRKYTGFKPETPVTWPKPQNTDNSKE